MREAEIKKLALNLDEIIEKCEEEEPEERVAEFLMSIGLIEKREGIYRLTDRGERFLKLPVE
jgi:predicted transcriptional regulator